MDYREIVAVTGMGGLYQLVTSKSDGAIVRALADGKTAFVSARKHSVTPIESIEIYTSGDNVRLHEVLQKMQAAEDATPLPDTKDPKAISAYFAQIFPEYDRERVYASDLKKMVKWYGLLKAVNLLDFSRYEQEESGEDAQASDAMPLEGEVQVTEHKKENNEDAQAASQSVEGGDADTAPTKKARTKKTDAPAAEGEEAVKKPRAKKADAPAEGGSEEAPKKVGRKKATEE